jgi:hypothetical protein
MMAIWTIQSQQCTIEAPLFAAASGEIFPGHIDINADVAARDNSGYTPYDDECRVYSIRKQCKNRS